MYLPLSLMLGYLDDSLLIRFAHRDSVSVGAGSKTIHLPFLQKPTQKNQQKGVFFPASEGTFGVEVPHNASGKRNIAIAALGPGDAGPAAWGLPCFLCSRLTPSGPPLGTTFIPWPWKEHVFPRISCCRRFPETDTQFCLAAETKREKKNVCVHGPDLFISQGKLPLPYNSGPSPTEESLWKTGSVCDLFARFQTEWFTLLRWTGKQRL